MKPIETLAELGARIRETRLAAGFSQSELARQLEMDRSALVRAEGGERKVTALELLRLAELLRVPMAHFVYHSPEAVTSRRRDLEDDAPRQERQRFQLDALLEAHLRDAEHLRSWGQLVARPDVPRLSVDSRESALEAARAARRYLGNTHGPLPLMADVAERVGLYLLVADHEGDGSSLTPERGFGVSVIGGDADPGRRRFTAAHEIGHHLLGDEYQSDTGVASSRDEREQLIDVFAGELLLPVDDVAGRWASFQAKEDDWERLLTLAAEYRVSWAVVLRVAEAAGVLTHGRARSLQHRTPQLGDFVAVTGSGPEPDLVTGTTGRSWRKAVLRALQDDKITRARAVEMLHGALTEGDLPAVNEPAP